MKRTRTTDVKLTLIVAPYDSGRRHEGFGKGPDALLSGGLVEMLTMNGHDIEVEDDVTALPRVWDIWASEVLESQDPVEETFNAAEAAFTTAAPDEDARTRVDELFTASEARCTRGSV